jgi:hypothetical protein
MTPLAARFCPSRRPVNLTSVLCIFLNARCFIGHPQGILRRAAVPLAAERENEVGELPGDG